MTTEETELTFVRCPSCRSLVPAVATRCRMCGHTFDGAVDAMDEEETSAQQPKSRVRQRTMSVSREEVEEVASGYAESSPSEEVADTNFSFQDRFSEDSTTAEDDQNEFDPMAALFGESQGNEEPSFEQEPQTPEQQDDPVDSAVFDSFAALDEKGADDEETTLFSGSDAGHSHSDESQGDESQGDESLDDESQSFDSDDEGGEDSDGDDESENLDAGSGERKRKRRRRRRKKKRPTEETETIAAKDESEQQQEASSSDVEEPAAQAEKSEEENKVEESFFEKEETMATQDVVEEHTNSTAPAQTSHAPEASANTAGGLVGWLVTYGPDGKGDSVEVRGGRFFIGRQKLRENDMVIGDSALSTPHCLVSAEPGRGIQIQDLMSEQGTFVKKAGSKSFSQITDASLIEHGDMLRFGAYELLVCLIP